MIRDYNKQVQIQEICCLFALRCWKEGADPQSFWKNVTALILLSKSSTTYYIFFIIPLPLIGQFIVSLGSVVQTPPRVSFNSKETQQFILWCHKTSGLQLPFAPVLEQFRHSLMFSGCLVNWSMGLPVPEAQYYHGFPSWQLASAHHSSCATTHACVHEHMHVWMGGYVQACVGILFAHSRSRQHYCGLWQ